MKTAQQPLKKQPPEPETAIIHNFTYSFRDTQQDRCFYSRLFFKLILSAALITLSLYTSACIVPLTPYNLAVRFHSATNLKQRLINSRELIKERKKQANQYSLAEKASVFEFLRTYFTLPPPFQPISDRQISLNQDTIHGSLAFTSERMAMLAYKYRAIGDNQTKNEIAAILDSRNNIDEQFGQPGQLPRSIIMSKTPLDVFRNNIQQYYLFTTTGEYYIYLKDDAHGNTFPNHFFGLLSIYMLVDDTQIKQKTVAAIRNHISYLLDENFVLKRLDGTPSTYGDLSGRAYFGLARNALLARLMMLEVALFILNRNNAQEDTNLITRIEDDLNVLKKRDAHAKIQDMRRRILNFSFNRPASERRVFLNLFLLANVFRSNVSGTAYLTAFENYWKEKRLEFNPFFTFLYLSQKPKTQWSFNDKRILSLSLEYIKSYPLDRDDREVLNSFSGNNEIVVIDRFPVITKRGLVPMNRTPLPIYRRGVRRHEWRGNAFRLNENINRTGTRYAHPLDFLLVYYIGLNYNFIPMKDQTINHEKIARFMKTLLTFDNLVNPFSK